MSYVFGITIFLAGCAENPTFSTPAVPISAVQSTRLDFSSFPWQVGGVDQVEALGNMTMPWTAKGTLAWQIDVAQYGHRLPNKEAPPIGLSRRNMVSCFIGQI